MGAASLILASLMWTAGADLPPEVWMKTRQVVIPIQLKPERQNEVRELLLFVSTDDGKSWNQEARVTPDKKGFRFGAPTDGRYWFTVCDVDFNGRRTPQDLNGVPPGLIINIDTRPPLVKFRSSDRIGDEISVVWHIEEENPDPSTLKLEFRPASDETAPWNNVPITPGPDGQAKFHVNTPGPVMVRMSFQDRAANQAQAINVVGANASSTSGYGAAPMPPTSLYGAGPMPPSGSNTRGGSIVPVEIDPSAASAAAPPPKVEQPLTAPERTTATTPASPPAPSLTPIASSSPGSGLPPRDSFSGAHDAGVASSGSGSPATPRPQMRNTQLVNSKQITLSYDVLRAGPSGVRRAFLYMTDNDGQTWQEVGRDELGALKVTANLPGEGTFGFRIVLESGAGLSKGPPQPGDQPELRVEVDLTPPEVILYAPAPHPNHRDTLILRWQATDKNLASNLVDLEYAEKEEGPWTKIAAVPNSGQYDWKLPVKMPVRVYLRAVARDLAGNIGEARTGQPQLIDLYKPEGAILNISGATMQVNHP